MKGEVKLKLSQSGMRSLPFLFIIMILRQISQAQAYECKVSGRIADDNDKTMYHQCYYLYGKIQYLHKKCPESTCFSPKLGNCAHQACGDIPPKVLYDCGSYDFTCTGNGVFANPQDPSLYYRCSKSLDKWDKLCFTCNSAVKTCFSSSLQQCISPSDEMPCATTTDTRIVDPKPDSSIVEEEPNWQCNGYKQFPCNQLGSVGPHGKPGDKSIYFECGDYNAAAMQGFCRECRKESRNCFIEDFSRCVENCGDLSGIQEYSCGSEREDSFMCTRQGYSAHPLDTSIFFHCNFKNDLWQVRCFTCSSQPKTCFSDTFKTCLSFNGEKCANVTLIDGGTKGVGTPDTSPTYSCTGYGDKSIPCDKLGEGKFGTKGDPSVFFNCEKDSTGTGLKATCTVCEKDHCFNTTLNECVDRKGEKCGDDVKGKSTNETDSACGHELEHFHCQSHGVGKHGVETNINAYIECTSRKGDPACHLCPEETKSCFDPVKDKCVENCSGIIPYSCMYQNDQSYPCKKEGYFAHPNDSSVYFKCVENGNSFIAFCFTCNENYKTCFSELAQACLPGKSNRCGKASETSRPAYNSSEKVTYDCTGYNWLSFPCGWVPPGTYAKPGDKSVYFTCLETNPGIKCEVCPKETQSCYIEEKGKCVENCGKAKPYECDNYGSKSYPCTKEGVFAHPKDTSVYFQCVKVGNEWKSICFTCSSSDKTCFNDKKKKCVSNGGKPCGSITEITNSTTNDSRTYNCEGYKSIIQICNGLGVGQHGMPGDKSVYVLCTKDSKGYKAECKVCPKKTLSCFSEKEKRCVENCGIPIPYDCTFYGDSSYPCKQEGYFAHPKESSIFFKCVKNGTGWQSLCFTCDKEENTCFSEIAQKCLPVNDDKCGPNKNMTGTNSTGPNYWSCSGYNNLSYPCDKVGVGQYENPGGDKSVYFICKNVNGKVSLECKACPKETKSCYFQVNGTCIENCGKGKDHKPYNCDSYDTKSYPCTKEGLFPNPKDTSVYFKCVKNGSEWQSLCLTCDKEYGTCFSEMAQTCLLPANGGKCGDSSNTNSTGTNSTNFWDCSGYNGLSYPCDKAGVGIFENPGDKSVYFICKMENGKISLECQTCPKETKSCYFQVNGTCIENCGKGKEHKPYNCDTYDTKSYSCTSEGLFANPKDSSVYFKCVKNGSEWQSLCLTCDQDHATCFNETAQTCLSSNGQQCGNGSNTNVTIDTNSTNFWDCNGYNNLSFPCDKVGVGTFENPGDKSIYFICKMENGKISLECQTCPKETKSCYFQANQTCIENCGKGKEHKPYNCDTYDTQSYPCEKEGLFANPKDSSVYFKCVLKNGEWQSLCVTCDQVYGTCFSEVAQTCVSSNGDKCGNSSSTNSTTGTNSTKFWDCAGYSNLSFQCDKVDEGIYENPGDRSVYFVCTSDNGKISFECHTCDNATKGCYFQENETCIENCGNGPDHQPYDCSTYNTKSYPCTNEGLFVNPKDSSVYFKCVLKDGEWQSLCLTCDEEYGTCFSEVAQTCLTANGDKCGNSSNTNSTVGTNSTGPNFWDCNGYNNLSFPCDKVGVGTYENPGDKSIYFICKNETGKISLECKACPNETKSCYFQANGTCVENCGKGKEHKPYNCDSYDTKSYPCTSEGLFANPQDSSVYFKCVKNGSDWQSLCLTCDKDHGTCFSEVAQTCLPTNGQYCGNSSSTNVTTGTNSTNFWSCNGYNNLSYPCDKVGVGVYENPGDKSIYFICKNDNGKINLECQACPNETKSCYFQAKAACIENCGKGKDPYNCDYYNNKSYPCTKEGVFANPNDTSIYFKCVLINNEWYSVCFTCSSSQQTCFKESDTKDNSGCVPNGGKPCGPITNNSTGTVNESRTYNCDGYQSILQICDGLGEGNHVMPGDKSNYVLCTKDDKGYKAECKVCPNKTLSCFSDEEQRCVENCGNPIPYDCTFYGDDSYPCKQEGYFAHPKESSIFFKCVKNGTSWQSFCFTCDKEEKTCFSEIAQKCLPMNGNKCGNSSNTNSTVGTNSTGPNYWSCSGYNNLSFPCDKVGVGTFENPGGDKSVYFICKNENGKIYMECQACPNETKSCYFQANGTCIENCGKGKDHKPYNCDTYDIKSYPCTSEGLFANPKDSSVYFKCVKNGSEWQSLCLTCDKEHGTCFSEVSQTCLPTNGQCGNSSNTNSTGTNSTGSNFWSCSGYNNLSYPCDKVGPGTYENPGDRSVYFICKNDTGKISLECQACPNETKSCYFQANGTCVENCGKGPDHKPYNCDTYDTKSYPCTTEGFFANPKDSSVYFKCVKNGSEWQSLCLTCDKQHGTCFNETAQTCLSFNGQPCGNGSSMNSTNGNSTNFWDCNDYNNLSYPCDKVGAGVYENPGDKSIYFICKNDNGKISLECKSCPSVTKSCYFQVNGTCIENCGKGKDPYNCDYYDTKSYPCTKEGIFANPNDTSVYFKCVFMDNEWHSVCFTCSSSQQTCFKESDKKGKSGCVTNDGKPCGPITNITNSTGKVNESRTHSCDGYKSIYQICDGLGLGNHVMPGDKSVYVTCTENKTVGGYEVECKTCPKETNSCFNEKQDRCVQNCGKAIPYDCTDQIYLCTQEGLFAHPKESSIYFQCIKNGTGWQSLCYTCDKTAQTCFSEAAQACLPINGTRCGGSSTTNSTNGNSTGPNFWNCDGYNNLSYPCDKVGAGTYENPGDKSIYFICKNETGKISLECKACPNETKSCYFQGNDTCIENCGKGNPHKPYNCDSYDTKAYPCTSEGLFANPQDSSVYFNCVKNGSEWQSLCLTCDKGHGTCFSEAAQSCLPATGSTCGNSSATNSTNGNNSTSTNFWNCDGYNNLSYPCDKVGAGTYENPGDKSIYFICKNDNGKISLECKACPNDTKSCYFQDKGACIENCGKGPDHQPYNCSTYNPKSFNCSKDGLLFSNPSDTSIYFQCVLKNNEYIVICNTCDKSINTCFSDKDQTCRNITDPQCGTNTTTNFTKIWIPQNCSAYPNSSLPCKEDFGIFPLPGDKTVYVVCAEDNGNYTSTCNICNQTEYSCFNPTSKICDDNCLPKDYKGYNCSLFNEGIVKFKCNQEGFFAYNYDSSIFFRCHYSAQMLVAKCFPCNSKYKSCFHNHYQVCLKRGVPCNETDPNEILPGMFIEDHRLYTCKGYDFSNINCNTSIGFLPYIGDPSVYVECINELYSIGRCHACSKPTKECFVPVPRRNKGACLANCGQGTAAANPCGSHTTKDFTCSKEGIFPHADTSKYFKCKNYNGTWRSFCYACKPMYCFDKRSGWCVKSTTKCGSSVIASNQTELESLTFSCENYANYSFDCHQYYPYEFNKEYALPGDRSVHYRCEATKNRWQDWFIYKPVCSACENVSGSCFKESSQACVKNCFGPPPDRYNCSLSDSEGHQCIVEGKFPDEVDLSIYFECKKNATYGNYSRTCHECNKEEKECFSKKMQECVKDIASEIDGSCPPPEVVINPSDLYNCSGNTFDCDQEGFFPDPQDSSVYFQCIYFIDKYISFCFACDKVAKTCFSYKEQRCLPMKDGKDCGDRDPVDVSTDLSYKGYSCAGYGVYTEDDVVFPCAEYGQGHFSTQGDRTVYFRCDVLSNAFCYVCDKSTNSCFDPIMRKCVPNCFGGTPLDKQYKCVNYDYNCTEPGVFVQPADTSVYYHCTKKPTQIQKRCFTCSTTMKTCYNTDRMACMKTTHPEVGCKGLADTVFTGTVDDGKSYDCLGFKGITCKQLKLTFGKKYTTPGDMTVTIKCDQSSPGVVKKECETCPEGTCYDTTGQVCKSPCAGPWTLNYKKCSGPAWIPSCFYIGIK